MIFRLYKQIRKDSFKRTVAEFLKPHHIDYAGSEGVQTELPTRAIDQESEIFKIE
jgi:hypothetical protein